jgi:FkbM family methyltransferase
VTFISYAQNFEDVMLWRALGRGRDGTGTWIDVGAGDPFLHSVTCAFHQRGWRGINLEPNGEYHARLRERRPRDVNLRVAAGERARELLFYRVPGTGLSTCDGAVAAQHRAAGWTVQEEQIEVRTLASICRDHLRGPVDFLKIDVGGMERAVLAGADFTVTRPRVVLVEAIRTLGQESSQAEWSGLLQQAGYRDVYFDGLNRFYVAAECHDALVPAFAAPPNVFDDFVRADDEPARLMREAQAHAAETEGHAQARVLAAEREIGRAERRVAQAQEAADRSMLRRDQELREAERQATTREEYIRNLEGLLARIYASTSWKLSRPVRVLGRINQRLRGNGGPAPHVPAEAPMVVPAPAIAAREAAVARRLQREAPKV